MTFTDIKTTLEIGESTGMPVFIFGHSGLGKTALCRHLFPQHRLILDEEFSGGGLSLLNSLVKTAKTLIFENLSEASLSTLIPVILNKSLYGERLENSFILTARNDYPLPDPFIKIAFSAPTAEEWLQWAEQAGIHPVVIKMVAEKSAMDLLLPRQLETLSRLLNAGIPSELLDGLLHPLIGNHPELMAMIGEGYEEQIDFEKVISLEEKDFITRIKQTNSKNIDRFNEELLKEIQFDESIITKEKLISYISSMDSQKSLDLLSGLLESEMSFDYLNGLLDDTVIQDRIDALIRR